MRFGTNAFPPLISVRLRAAGRLSRSIILNCLGSDGHLGGRRAHLGSHGRAQIARHKSGVHDSAERALLAALHLRAVRSHGRVHERQDESAGGARIR